MPADPGGQAPPASGGKKILGMNRTTVLVFGLALVGGAAYFLLKNRSSSTAANTTGTAATGSCTDQYGNSIPCPEQGTGVDYSGELSTMQTELESLLAAESNESGGTSTSGGGGSSGGGTSTGTLPGPVTTKTPGGGGTTTTKKPAIPAMPQNVKVIHTWTNSAQVTWGKVSGATSYTVRVTYQDKLVKTWNTASTTANVGGLTRNHTYTFHVKACNASGCSSETNGPIIKTPL